MIGQLKHPFFVIIGPSGSGKTKVAEAVFPSDYKVISHTTRPIRNDEKNGVDYYFETKEQFEKLLNDAILAEYDTYHGNQYGVGIEELIQKTSNHYAYDVLTFQGFQEIEKQFGRMVIPIFLDVSKKNVLSRLQSRQDGADILKQRGELYDQDSYNINKVMTYSNHYIIDGNQSFEKVVRDVKQIVNEVVEKT